MFSITIQAASLTEFRQYVAELYGNLYPSNTESQQIKMHFADSEAKNRIDEDAEDKAEVITPPKRNRRTKAEMAAVKKTDDKDAELVTAEPVGKVSKEDVYTALQEVNVTRGLPVARDILKHFGAQRMSELPEANFSEFIYKCREAVELA